MNGQHLLLGIEGPELRSEEVARLQRIQPAGVILFSRNIVSAEQTRALADHVRSLFSYEPIIAIDQEGGRVTRTKDIAPVCPSAVDLSAAGRPDWIAKAGMLTADLLRLLGVNVNFAPVLDIDHFPGLQNALRERCWGDDPQRIIDYAGQWNRWLRKRGIASCAKHFPSCGLAQSDPHHDLPTAQVSKDDLLRRDILPYTALMPELDAVMTSHVRFPLLDDEHPASLSRAIIHDFLRMQLGFDRHLVFTDDLDMGAIQNAYGAGMDVKQAIFAGNDIALICHRMDRADEAVAALAKLPMTILDDAQSRICRFREKLNGPLRWSNDAWLKTCDEIQQLRDQVPVADEVKADSPVAQY
ncbi:MAG: beta-N-acetylhexosaminidase [Verrucomicrobiota bacterium]|jgi:beta-N-acetylhexosaminidase